MQRTRRKRRAAEGHVIAHENQRTGKRAVVSARCSASRALAVRQSCALVRSAGHAGKPRAHALSRWPALLHNCVRAVSRSFAERAVVTLSPMRPSLAGPPCYFVAAVCGPLTAECASFPRMRYNHAAHPDARGASQFSPPSRSRAGGRERYTSLATRGDKRHTAP